MSERIAIYGGSFNPPGLHHRRIVEALLPHFNKIFIVICGFRPDKAVTNGINPIHRAVMVDLTFRDLPGVEIIHDDLETGMFTPLVELDRKFSTFYPDRWHVIGSDLIIGAAVHQAKIQHWVNGPEIWEQCQFAVIARADAPVEQSDLPPRHEVFMPGQVGSSAVIRDRRYVGQSISDLVTPAVERYIRRYGLYDGLHRHPRPTLAADGLRFGLLLDAKNSRAAELATDIRRMMPIVDDHPDLYLVLGGDGTVLHAVREHWPERRPFLGLNLGTVGFLANDVTSPSELSSILEGPWNVYQNPMLLATVEYVNGSVAQHIGFNDVYVRSANAQTAWLEVAVDDSVVLPRLMGDGVLVASAAGSTAYARSMGATPITVGSDSLILVGSNVSQPYGWKSAPLFGDSRVRITNVDPSPIHGKRPTDIIIDGRRADVIHSVTVRSSRVAEAELLFLKPYDLRAKFIRSQFPPA